MQPEKMTKKTQCVVVYPISSALLEADLFLKNVKSFTTKNDMQKKFLDEFHAYCKGDVSRIDEMNQQMVRRQRVSNQTRSLRTRRIWCSKYP
jgi:hypothetical protein